MSQVPQSVRQSKRAFRPSTVFWAVLRVAACISLLPAPAWANPP
nr:MAG TPA: hypothetical protein [Caudoviricetes sp.]